MDRNSRIYVAGHCGLVGSAIVRLLKIQSYHNIIVRAHSELDLRIQTDVERFFELEKPEVVVLAAAKVGGIYANMTCPADFIYDNLLIESNVIGCAYKYGVKKLLFLGSSCIYPKLCPQPIKEEYLLSGPLEATNEAYALAKIAGLKMCQFFNSQYQTRFIGVMPCNLYGPQDNYQPQSSHVLAGLLHRMHLAKVSNQPEVEVWGTGKPRREFLHVDDLAEACLFLMNYHQNLELINIGTGRDVSILELAELIKKIVGYHGRLVFNPSKPDGTYQKVLDVTRINQLGWKSRIEFEEGIRDTYNWYLKNKETIRV